TEAQRFQTETSAERFRTAKQCLELVTRQSQAQNDIEICEAQPKYSESYARCSQSNSSKRKIIQETGTAITARGCSSDPQILDKDYYNATLQAAKMGDPAAQICFAQGRF